MYAEVSAARYSDNCYIIRKRENSSKFERMRAIVPGNGLHAYVLEYLVAKMPGNRRESVPADHYLR